MNILRKLQKNLVVAIPLTMIAGLIFGANYNASFLKSAIVPMTFLMVYPMMVNMQLKKVFEPGGSKLQFFTQFVNFGIIPFVAFGIGMLFFAGQPLLIIGLLLTGLLPTSGMTISWTGMAKGNIEAAIKMTVFGLFIGSVLTPLYIKLLMGTSVNIDMLKIFKQIMIIVVIPLILGNITQRLIILKYGIDKYKAEIKQLFPPFSTIGVIGIVFVAMALKAKGIISNPIFLLKIAVPLVLLYIFNFLISSIVGKLFFKRDDAVALLYGTVLRNLSIALAIAMTAFGKQGAEIALIVALGYIIQVQMAAWSVKLIDRIF